MLEGTVDACVIHFVLFSKNMQIDTPTEPVLTPSWDTFFTSDLGPALERAAKGESFHAAIRAGFDTLHE